MTIFIDADACPVRPEVFKVAERYQIEVVLVANIRMSIPDNKLFRFVVVNGNLDAADDWIVENVIANDIVITADIPLASRCLEKDAHTIGPKGKSFTNNNIGEALATRELLSQLRDAGMVNGGPKPFEPKDRSQFLQELDRVIQLVKKNNRLSGV